MARPERAFIAAAGCAVASVEYRTVRQHATYRDGLADVRAAIDHLAGRADAYGIDRSRIAVWGESAGGYLASMAGLTDPRIRAVVDEFGASDLSHIADGFDPRMRAASPTRATRSTATAPPTPTRSISSDPRHRRSCSCTATTTASSRPRKPCCCTSGVARGRSGQRPLPPHGAGHRRLSLSRGQARQWTSVQVMAIIKDFLDAHLRS